MGDDLEERLRGHARAFEGLMSLIPADRYYEKDNSEQYKKKKQTPEERRAARMAKLNPENHKTVMDVMDENERKRKRELGINDDAEPLENSDGVVEEKPRQGMKQPKSKKAKLDETSNKSILGAAAPAIKLLPVGVQATTVQNVEPTSVTDKAQKRKEKEERKKEKLARKQEKKEAKKASKKATAEIEKQDDDEVMAEAEADDEETTLLPADDIDAVDVSGLDEPDANVNEESSSPSPVPDSIFSNASAPQSGSSTSSLDVASTEAPLDTGNTPKDLSSKLPAVDKALLQKRLQEKIEALRAARKADGPDGRPARNRQELIEARRKKAEQKKQVKKDQRKNAREDELKERAEAELARLRGSGSPMGSDMFSPSIPRSPENTNFNFGRVAFEDGDQLNSNLSYFNTKHHTKGPSDAKTALAAAQKKTARLNDLDEEKRKDIEEKDLWLNAKKKVHGERVRDDTSLLKKTLKRKEKEKAKSTKEWNERIDGVQKSQEARQKKREENLAKRRDEKGGSSSKKKTGSAGGGKKRPGFEGGFRSKPSSVKR